MKKLMRLWAVLITICFVSDIVFSQAVFAAAAPLALPVINPASPLSASAPCTLLRGLRIDPKDPLKFEFIIDQVPGKKLDNKELHRLISYFMAALTVPENDFWVNLSPYEQDSVIPQQLSDTDFGRDLLVQDYVLKQVAASLTYPETALGKKYWQSVNGKGTNGRSPANSNFNKVWITPANIDVFEDNNMAIVGSAKLKVLTEEDYLATQKNGGRSAANESAAMKAFKANILPAINKEVNEGANFSSLRQMYYSFALALWFKQKVKTSLYKYYLNQNKTAGITLDDKTIKEKVYNKYVEAFKKGAYDYIKKESAGAKVAKRQYFSGGITAYEVGAYTIAALKSPAGEFDYSKLPADLVARLKALAQGDRIMEAHFLDIIAHYTHMKWDSSMLTDEILQEMNRVHGIDNAKKRANPNEFKPLIRMLSSKIAMMGEIESLPIATAIVKELASDKVQLLGMEKWLALAGFAVVVAQGACGGLGDRDLNQWWQDDAGAWHRKLKDGGLLDTQVGEANPGIDGGKSDAQDAKKDTGSTTSATGGAAGSSTTSTGGKGGTGGVVTTGGASGQGGNPASTGGATGPFTNPGTGGVAGQGGASAAGGSGGTGGSGTDVNRDAGTDQVADVQSKEDLPEPDAMDSANGDGGDGPKPNPDVPPDLFTPKFDGPVMINLDTPRVQQDDVLPPDNAKKDTGTNLTIPAIIDIAAGSVSIIVQTHNATANGSTDPTDLLIPADYWKTGGVTLDGLMNSSEQVEVTQFPEFPQLIADLLNSGVLNGANAHEIGALMLRLGYADIIRKGWSNPDDVNSDTNVNPNGLTNAKLSASLQAATATQWNSTLSQVSAAMSPLTSSGIDSGVSGERDLYVRIVTRLLLYNNMTLADFKAANPVLFASGTTEKDFKVALNKAMINGVLAGQGETLYADSAKTLALVGIYNPTDLANPFIIGGNAIGTIGNTANKTLVPVALQAAGQDFIDGLQSSPQDDGTGGLGAGVCPAVDQGLTDELNAMLTGGALQRGPRAELPSPITGSAGLARRAGVHTPEMARLRHLDLIQQQELWLTKGGHFEAMEATLSYINPQVPPSQAVTGKIQVGRKNFVNSIATDRGSRRLVGDNLYVFINTNPEAAVTPEDVQAIVNHDAREQYAEQILRTIGSAGKSAAFYNDKKNEVVLMRDAHILASAMDIAANGGHMTDLQRKDAAAIREKGEAALYDAEGTRDYQNKLVKSVLGDDVAVSYAQGESEFQDTYGGVNLAKAKIKVHLGQPIKFTASQKLVNMFKHSKSFSFAIISAGTPFILR